MRNRDKWEIRRGKEGKRKENHKEIMRNRDKWELSRGEKGKEKKTKGDNEK